MGTTFKFTRRPEKAGVLFLFMAFAWICAALGDETSTAFDQANRLYEQGKYPEAIAAYEKLAQQKKISAALYFNLGNAYFKQGQPGQAIVYYRLAQRLDPRDPDIRANLHFARESVGGKAPDTLRWQRWLSLLTLNELTLFTTALFWLWFSLLIAGQARRDWQNSLRSSQVLSGIILALTLLWLGLVAHNRLGTSPAVVVAHEAVVRYGPFEEAQGFYTLRDGAELRVLDRKDIWLQVTDASKRIGWLQNKDVVVLPRG